MDTLTLTEIESLVPQAARGDRDAFARIVDATRTVVSSIALAILRDVDASRDVAQDVFLAAWRDIGKLRSAQSLMPWLRQMARNRAHHELRSKVRRRAVMPDGNLDGLLEVATDGRTHDAEFLEREAHRRLAIAIDTLPDDAREVVTLFYREGRSVKQVASLLGMREDAVKQRLSRARNRLRESLLDEIGETLRATAPGAAFTAAVMALTLASPPVAAAASLGIASKAAGAAGGSVAVAALGAILGVAGGALGVVLGLRPLEDRARDDEERRGLARLMRDALISVVAFSMLLPIGQLATGRASTAALSFVAFLGALGYLYMVRLPRIIAPRLARERLEDPAAIERHRRDERLRWFGFAAGAAMGGAGVAVGWWLSGSVW